MDSTFGDYITKEYGLLKQILSYLKPCDLWNAKSVCREWSTAVDSLLEKNPVCHFPKLYRNSKKYKNLLPSKIMFPALVIQSGMPSDFKNNKTRCKKCNLPLRLCVCEICYAETSVISLGVSSSSTLDEESLYITHPYTVLALPSSSEIQVSTFYLKTKSSIFKQAITDDVVRLCTGGNEPIKCLLVISKTMPPSPPMMKWLNALIARIVDRQGNTFAFSGGELCPFMWQKYSKICRKSGLIIIALRGNNVMAHSDMLVECGKPQTESFMQELAHRVGPLPQRASRVAFIFHCVDRFDSDEGEAFGKFFPSMPRFVFEAYGEYGMRSCSSDHYEERDTKKKLKMTYNFFYTTSILILTFTKI